MADGTLSPARLSTVLTEVCAATGIDPNDAQLIKFTNNAVFRLPHAGAVVRIAGSTAVENRVPKVIQVATWLAEHDVPAVRLLPGVKQPVTVAGQLATVWELVPSVGPVPTGTDMARLLKLWHGLPEPTFTLPTWKPLDSIRARLADPDLLPAHEHSFLTRRAEEIEEELADVQFVLPQGPIWGDAFLGNLIPGLSGPVVCDFDGSAYGPREWDLTPIAVGAVRFSYPKDDHALLAKAYDFDVMTWNGFPVLRRLRELQLVTSVIPVLRSNPGLREQWRHRFESLRNGDPSRWTPYA
ncbi:aminoglycoside phosphotransferase family protein [Actinoplanes sp. NPDC051475]|uniref:aminoglycoside phosphotransferase family protein n=1 Tax=Actinoplanes sp. NPDC051475 TaxID=3157225 RepID=UPI00344B5AF0